MVEEELSPQQTTDEDSDLSDVETEGYCDDSRRAKISMSVKPVREPRIKQLYYNTDKVHIFYIVIITLKISQKKCL